VFANQGNVYVLRERDNAGCVSLRRDPGCMSSCGRLVDEPTSNMAYTAAAHRNGRVHAGMDTIKLGFSLEFGSIDFKFRRIKRSWLNWPSVALWCQDGKTAARMPGCGH
jgi:hypothetical protein